MRLTKKISDLIIVLLIVFVAVVGFYPQAVTPINANENYGAIYSGDKTNGYVALMFNVYENTPVVERILDTLKEHNAQATFFVGGCWADDNKQTLIRILDEGHLLGNHGYFHKDHKKLSEKANYEEIKNNHDIVKALCGYEMNLFAPPSGSFSTTTLKVAEKLGYKTIMWTKDTIDWRDSNLDTLFNRATKNLTSGDFILMHPKEHTAKVLDRVLTYIEKIGLQAKSVSACLPKG